MEMNISTVILEPQPAQPIPPPDPARPTRPRCHYVSRTGKPCRYLGMSAEKPFCKNHLPPPPPGSPEELAATLEEMAGNFDTPENVTNVLYTIFFSLVHGSISERKAGLLTYIAQTILHSHRATAYWEKLQAEKEAQQLETERRLNPFGLRWNPPERDGHCEPDTEQSDSECSADLPVSSVQAGKEEAGIKASATLKNSALAAAADSGSVPSVLKSDSAPEKTSASEGGHDNEAELPRPADLNHFFPVDPTLPAHLQNPNRVAAPPVSDAELDRRNRQFDRVHGFVRRGKQSYPTRESPDWKILNGR